MLPGFKNPGSGGITSLLGHLRECFQVLIICRYYLKCI